MKKFIIIIGILFSIPLMAQQELLQSGPMLGYSEMLEVPIWIQTKSACEVKIIYWESTIPEKIFSTDVVKMQKQDAYTAKLYADNVEPGLEYEYAVYINDQKLGFDYPTQFKTQAIWKWRGNPPEFTIVAGSGTYINETQYDRPGKGYGSNYQIFETMHKASPDLMIWLGDNTYLREPDWNSRTGILNRNTHTRSLKELQPLLASTHHYAIWDDHDFGPNDSDGSFWNKETTLEAFKVFWPNPSFGFEDLPGAISFFNYSDVDFILVDNRYYREPNKKSGSHKTMLGKKQLEWLKNSLISSVSTFKIVVMGGQFLNTNAGYETYINNGFKNERDEIIEFIYQENIENVIFLTGDVHYTVLDKLEQEGKPTIYELTFSPFTSGVNVYADKINDANRIEGTLVMEHNFGWMKFEGNDENRRLVVRSYNADGKQLFEYIINPVRK
ncbi:MAG: alkaline phosphatase D family protein [Bacteroidales bacterium]|jgi:alkaline phosphatase D|nr:alkaline phosphatase D family protein [Bacteroidales bacterium]